MNTFRKIVFLSSLAVFPFFCGNVFAAEQTPSSTDNQLIADRGRHGGGGHHRGHHGGHHHHHGGHHHRGYSGWSGGIGFYPQYRTYSYPSSYYYSYPYYYDSYYYPSSGAYYYSY